MTENISILTGLYYKDPRNYPIHIPTYKMDFNHFEAILDVDGSFYEAPNGHQIGLKFFAALKMDITFDEVAEKCPIEYYADYMTWLHLMSGAIPVWRSQFLGEPNEAQKQALQQAHNYGLFIGKVPK